jgi:ABC-type multidrug transport system ATPase subunit
MTSAEEPRIDRVVAERIVKTFGATAALRGVDMTVEAGALTLIEGPNGSGKSTLLGILGTVLRPTSGTVRYEPLGTVASEIRRTLGWLSHEALAYGDLSGRENVELVARLTGLDPAEAYARAEARFELGAFADRPLRTNSRGQKQRVALARALVHQPSLVLLDEPTTGLDRAGVARLRRVLEEELARGTLVAVVTHEPELFGTLPVRRVVLERGRRAKAEKPA